MAKSREPFGAWLLRRRQELKLTQIEIHLRGGPSQTYLSDLESSAETSTPKTPHRKMIAKIALGLGIPVAEVEEAAGYLKGTTSPPPPFTPDAACAWFGYQPATKCI